MAVVPYEVTAEDGLRMVGVLPSPAGPLEARAADDPPPADDPRPFLGTHNVVHDLVTVGCFECEQPLTKDTANTDCPGQPPGKLAYVDEGGRDAQPNEIAARGGNVPVGLRGVGRNDPCPCGSGEKFKRCHGS